MYNDPANPDYKAVAPISYSISILGIVVGTLLALLLLPTDYFEHGRLRATTLMMVFGLMVGPIASSITDLRCWLRAESIMMLGLVYWLFTELLYPDYSAYQLTRGGVSRAFLYTGMFAICIHLGSWLAHHWRRGERAAEAATPDFHGDWLFGALLICALLGLLARLIPCEFSPACISGGLFGARQVGAWNPTRLGGSDAFIYHLSYFGYLCLPLTVAIHHRSGRLNWRVGLGLLLTALMLLFMIKDGGRRLVGMVAGAGLLTWLLLQPRLGLRQTITGLLAVLMLLALMEIMLIFRTSEGGVITSLLSGRALTVNPLEEGPKVDNNFNSLVRTLDLIPEYEDHTGWQAIVYWLVRPIPRSFWPGKPVDPGINIPWELGERWSIGFTLTLSAIGDWYIGFGLLSLLPAGLMMGWLGGRLVLTWLRPRVRETVLYSLGAMCLFIGLRNYMELILMSYPILALLLIERLTIRRASRQAETAATA